MSADAWMPIEDENQLAAVFPVPPPMCGEQGNALFVDVAGLLDDGLPEPVRPRLLRRSDGHALFYAGQVNLIFGDPESAKTLLATAAVTEALEAGRSVLWVDIDHNGPEATISRLLTFGVSEDALRDPERFCYAEPEDKAHLTRIMAHVRGGWRPAVAVVDSIGELLPMLGLSSNSPDDFTLAHAFVLKPLAMAGACVLAIDHLPKNTESRASGPTGTTAKRRAVGGVSLRITVSEAFAPGRGGAAHLHVNKDRHGGLRRYCPTDGKEPYAGSFVIACEDGALDWSVRVPKDGSAAPDVYGVSSDDIAALDQLDPPPGSVRDVRDRLKWRTERAADVLRVWRSRRSPALPGNGKQPHDESVTHFPHIGEETGNALCTVCATPLHPVQINSGETTHPACDEVAS